METRFTRLHAGSGMIKKFRLPTVGMAACPTAITTLGLAPITAASRTGTNPEQSGVPFFPSLGEALVLALFPGYRLVMDDKLTPPTRATLKLRSRSHSPAGGH
jgi:hypothetical protein